MLKRAAVVVVLLLTLLAPTQAGAVYSFKGAFGSGVDPGNLFRTPVAMAKDENGFIYMVDMGNSRIFKMDAGGKVVKTIGSLGSSPGKFNMPFGIAVDREGNFLVADTGNYRIQKFDRNFNFLKSWGTKGDSPEVRIPEGNCRRQG